MKHASRLQAVPHSIALRRAALLGAALATAAALGWTRPAAAAGPDRPAASGCPAMLDVSFPRLQDEAPQNLCQYRGKVLLVVNTASYCGYTRQYEGLEQLYAKYRDRGLVVLAFPSNDFSQEPGSKEQIAELCFNTYGVKFPIFSKTAVSGKDANPLFATLARSTGQPPKWNFHKYLVGRDGSPVAAFPSAVEPNDGRLTREIEKLLAG
ncbi:Hydroperoxy fatty acid reductase gpx1 [Pigmentiphaga humi]|uniref:Glutathione peroxidase n=1 Tax=Pigmentiphaga humi TaxID=2478468 RepID=A0A3P4AXF5_9BURK|nr:glutathione peroxidase [Pigmentiphaga humi]VCU68080.1 Hydroperoxy fatty acid reductase gpx1 [Pigmentiphaga humi]